MKIKKMILMFGFLSILAGPGDASCKGSGNDGWTALMEASSIGDIETVQSLIDTGSEVNARTFFMRTTALMAASRNGHDEVAKLLIEKGAEVRAHSFGGWTSLMNASRYGHIETVKLLIEEGAEVQATDGLGRTALEMAEHAMQTSDDDPDLRERSEEVVRILKENGAKN